MIIVGSVLVKLDLCWGLGFTGTVIDVRMLLSFRFSFPCGIFSVVWLFCCVLVSNRREFRCRFLSRSEVCFIGIGFKVSRPGGNWG